MADCTALKKILVFDIETVSTHAKFEDLSERMQLLWSKKSKNFHYNNPEEFKEEDASGYYNTKAGIFAEFAKVVCISVGVFSVENGVLNDIRVKSFYGHDESIVIQDFFGLMDTHFYDPLVHQISGHNIREFDIPFLCRRATLLNISLPKLFQIQGKKPWQIDYFYDTLEMWKFGDYKNYTSLDLLANLFDIPSPKEDLDGSQVGSVYWEEDGIVRIAKYCEKDIITSSKVLMRLLKIPYEKDLEVISMTKFDKE